MNGLHTEVPTIPGYCALLGSFPIWNCCTEQKVFEAGIIRRSLVLTVRTGSSVLPQFFDTELPSLLLDL